jgi:hypothetical protein
MLQVEVVLLFKRVGSHVDNAGHHVRSLTIMIRRDKPMPRHGIGSDKT